MSPRVSVVLTVFERSRLLRHALLAWRRQTFGDFELIVADDGSGPDVARVIAELAPTSPYSLRHVRHGRRGHRRAATINMGLAASIGERILFTDGDCLPSARLLDVHLAAFEPRRMLIGGRVSLDAATTDAIDDRWVLAGAYERHLTPAQERRLRAKHAKNVWHIATRRRRRPHNFGLNMSLDRRDVASVNGFDEAFMGWGSADGDLRERLKLVGVRPKSVWHRAVVFHQHHEVDPTRADKARNASYARRLDVHPWAARGLDRHLVPEARGRTQRASPPRSRTISSSCSVVTPRSLPYQAMIGA